MTSGRARGDLDTATALERAGELHEAARLFEAAGEHRQAAALRLEHAGTLADTHQRLWVLREGCARIPADTHEGRVLHIALSELLLAQADRLDPGPRKRTLIIEAAHALDEAGEHIQAGDLYESLHLLVQAASAYEKGGALARLELVLELLERKEQIERSLGEREREVETAWSEGRRREAHTLLLELVRLLERLGRAPKPVLAQRLATLESSMLRARRVDLRHPQVGSLRIQGGPRFRIGRAPDAHLSLPVAALSRNHVELLVHYCPADAQSVLLAADMGSREGSFWNGEPLDPGDATSIVRAGKLALGFAIELDVVPIATAGGVLGAWIRGPAGVPTTLFLPGGGPLALSPDHDVPAHLHFDAGWVVFEAASDVGVWLNGEPLGTGARVELLVGDSLVLRSSTGSIPLEIVA